MCYKDILKLKIRNVTRGTLLADSVEVADTSKKRRTGLLKHDKLDQGEGLWIAPCEAVHTFGMKFPIDVVFLSAGRKVLKTRREMVRRKLSACLWASSVLELPAGTLAATRTEKGDQLEFEKI